MSLCHDSDKGSFCWPVAMASQKAAARRGQALSRSHRTPVAPSILLLHGGHQTGQLLLGRVSKLRQQLAKRGWHLVAPDGLFESKSGSTTNREQDDSSMRVWWRREAHYRDDLTATLSQIQELWRQHDFCGIMGFSQGAQLAHILAISHICSLQQQQQGEEHTAACLPGLKFVIMVAGCDPPFPKELVPLWSKADHDVAIPLPSLHVWGSTDRLITPHLSETLSRQYNEPVLHIHEGGHHVPMRADNVRAYVSFIQTYMQQNEELQPATKDTATTKQESTVSHSNGPTSEPAVTQTSEDEASAPPMPDEETAQAQADELEVIALIFPEEFQLISRNHPITYHVALHASEDDRHQWPPQPIALQFCYPHDYPLHSRPIIELIHANNVFEFSSQQRAACLQAMHEAAMAEQGMPSVLSCIAAARAFFETGQMAELAVPADTENEASKNVSVEDDDDGPEELASGDSTSPALLASASLERIQQCNLQGLQIAQSILGYQMNGEALVVSRDTGIGGKGGQWTYTIGLVGKPSAGKSTFFNAATAFARQRDDSGNALGGATMAPHPFTTIDPNVGYCLVPAPPGSCPEDELEAGHSWTIGSTHGRDHLRRRLVPVLLKDVAGLVPGAYQGRGRGNKFLNDLTDADVLIHVLDASGMADAEGNLIDVVENVSQSDGLGSVTNHPLNDLAWIRNELIEWVFSNLMFKWDTIRRKGRSKLEAMFSGYGQPQATTWDILNAVEAFMSTSTDDAGPRESALDHLEEWDVGDVHRLVSAFLGVRFPMALALNKFDMPPSRRHVEDILKALPTDGAHVGIPLSAHREMTFIRCSIARSSTKQQARNGADDGDRPKGVWACLQAALSLREPLLVFPVADMTTYASLPGLQAYATGDPSLPNVGMVSCLQDAGGTKPTLWDWDTKTYGSTNTKGSRSSGLTSKAYILRDCLVMKPGSMVEDVFLTLKRLGALGGEFVRAEGAGRIGEKAKLIPKYDQVTKNTRILKIMSSKRSSWQR
jgi:ribosome-binding ATPase